MWTVVILIILFIVGKFLYDRNQQTIHVGRQGGMENKYKILVEKLMGGHSDTRIFQRTMDSLILGVSNAGGSTLFELLETFGNVTITWEMTSPMFGKHKLKWTFPEYMDQLEMYNQIENDLDKYQKNAINTSPFRDKR